MRITLHDDIRRLENRKRRLISTWSSAWCHLSVCVSLRRYANYLLFIYHIWRLLTAKTCTYTKMDSTHFWRPLVRGFILSVGYSRIRCCFAIVVVVVSGSFGFSSFPVIHFQPPVNCFVGVTAATGDKVPRGRSGRVSVHLRHWQH